VTLVINGAASAGAADDPFLGPLVARVCVEFAADRTEVMARAVGYLAAYEGARVRSFVPILVEKRLRDSYRRPASDPVGP
jgi:hypothetical protein